MNLKEFSLLKHILYKDFEFDWTTSGIHTSSETNVTPNIAVGDLFYNIFLVLTSRIKDAINK